MSKKPATKKTPAPKPAPAAAPAPTAEKAASAIQSAAADINVALKPEPALNLALDDETLSKELTAILPQIEEGDELSLATWKTLKALGWGMKAPKTKAVPKAGKGERKPVDLSKCSKAVIYLAWKKGTKDIEKLQKLVSGAVKEGTIRSWLGGWKNGKNLPAVANG